MDKQVPMRVLAVPEAISNVLHWTDTILEQVRELDKRLSPILRIEPADTVPCKTEVAPSTVALANDITVAADRARSAVELLDDIFRRLEL